MPREEQARGHARGRRGRGGRSNKTVSLALRGDQSVARATAARVCEAASRLGYASRGTRRQAIGVVAPYIGHRVYSDLFGSLRCEAATYEFTVLLMESTGEPAIEKTLLAELRCRGVDGVIMIAPRLSAEDLGRESRLRQPIVTIGMPPAGHAVDVSFARIEIDHEAGGRLGTRHLLEHGHTRIAYLAGRLSSASDRGRRAGYRAALEASRIEMDEWLIVELDRHSVQPWPDYDLGYEQCVQLLGRDVVVDAVLAYSDAIAIGALPRDQRANVDRGAPWVVTDRV